MLQLLRGASRLQLPYYAYIDERKRQDDVCVRAQDRAAFGGRLSNRQSVSVVGKSPSIIQRQAALVRKGDRWRGKDKQIGRVGR